MSKTRHIEVADYDPAWPALFEGEANDLAGVFEDVLVQLHHVGSTSVPGLAAKPTIDILIEVATGTDIPGFDHAMQALGYICRGECLDATVPGVPGRFYYVRKHNTVHLTHVHTCASGHADIGDQLSFRDYLRSHPDVACTYGNLKRDLAETFEYDNLGYMLGKDEFVKETIVRARQWRIQAQR